MRIEPYIEQKLLDEIQYQVNLTDKRGIYGSDFYDIIRLSRYYF